METSPIEVLLCALLGICTPRHEYVVVPPTERQLDLANPQEEGRADIVIRIDENSQLFMDGEEVSLDTLRSVLNAKAKEHPDAVVLVSVNPNAQSGVVLHVTEEILKSDLGNAIQVALAD